MNPPDYFIADLGSDAPLSHELIREACQTLRRNRERHLAQRSTESMVGLLCETAGQWLTANSPWRRRALQEGPAALGFSASTLERGLISFFRQFNPGQLRQWLRQDLGGEHRLDRFEEGEAGLARAWVRGPDLLVHVGAGNLPPPTLHGMMLGLLLRSAQFIKCARGTTLLPRLLGHSLYEIDPKAAACLEIAAWAGGREDLESALFQEAACVTATGRDDTLESIRARVPAGVRFLGYGHKVSFGYVTRESLSRHGAPHVLTRATDDITAWDQQGCLSPHVLYVEEGGSVSPLQFAQQLGEALAAREQSEPRGRVSLEEAAVISLKRDFYRVRAAHSEETQLWHSADSTAWTVVYEADPMFQTSCLNRFIYVKPARSLEAVLHAAEPIRAKVSTVGLAASPARVETLAVLLAHWGASRVCPLGQMQAPPLAWHHDGRPALGDLVTWSDHERDGSGVF